MAITFNLATIILFCLLAQGVFASGLLVLKKENRQANYYLSLLILLLSLWLGDAFFRTSGLYNQDPDLYFLPIYFSLGFGPLIYFYTQALTSGNSRLRGIGWVHFGPVVLQFLFYVFLQLQDYSYRREFWLTVHRPYTYDLELIISFTSLLIYLIASRRLIIKYKQKLRNNFSSIHQIALNWLGTLHIILAFLAFFWILEAVFRMVWLVYPLTPLSSITIGLTILIMAGGGILQKDLSRIYSSFSDANSEVMAGLITDPELLSTIQTAMLEQRLYLIQELTLKKFAGEIGLPARSVSEVINQGLNKTFIDFVNEYRVEHFKQLVIDPDFQHLSLFGLALESGFNSKSTFNRVFKKMEGKSPSEFRKAKQNSN